MTKENLIPKTETVAELKSEMPSIVGDQIPSFEEFLKSYESDERVSKSYGIEIDSYGEKGYGPCIPYSSNCRCTAEQLREQLRNRSNQNFRVEISLAGDGLDGFSSFGEDTDAGAWARFCTKDSFYSIYYEGENSWKREEPFFGSGWWETKILIAKNEMVAQKLIDGLKKSGKNGIWVEATGMVLGQKYGVINFDPDGSSCREKRQEALNILKEAVSKWERGESVSENRNIRMRSR